DDLGLAKDLDVLLIGGFLDYVAQSVGKCSTRLRARGYGWSSRSSIWCISTVTATAAAVSSVASSIAAITSSVSAVPTPSGAITPSRTSGASRSSGPLRSTPNRSTSCSSSSTAQTVKRASNLRRFGVFDGNNFGVELRRNLDVNLLNELKHSLNVFAVIT